MRSRILGTGSYVPRCTTLPENGDVAPMLATTSADARRKNGHAHSILESREGVADLALVAALETLAAAGCEAREVDCIVLADEAGGGMPGSGGVLGAKLGVPGAPAFDIHNQSGGFLYGLSIADHFVRLGTHGKVLVVAAETPSGNGAATAWGANAAAPAEVGAALVTPERDEGRGILGTGLHADGRFTRAFATPVWRGNGDASGVGLQLAARAGSDLLAECYRYPLETMREALAACGLAADDVALFVLNRGSRHLISRLAQDLGVPSHRMVAGAGAHVKSTGGSIPIALDALLRGGSVRRDDVIVLCSFGAGFVWAWTAVRW